MRRTVSTSSPWNFCKAKHSNTASAALRLRLNTCWNGEPKWLMRWMQRTLKDSCTETSSPRTFLLPIAATPKCLILGWLGALREQLYCCSPMHEPHSVVRIQLADAAFDMARTASSTVSETSKTLTKFFICRSLLVPEIRLQRRNGGPFVFALECIATSVPSPELSIIETFFKSRTIFFFPWASRLFT